MRVVRCRLAAYVTCAVLAVCVALPSAAVAEKLASDAADATLATVSDLVSNPMRYNGLTVETTGEAVGEILVADAGHRWVNIAADGALIGVYLSNEDCDKITVLGSYSARGTRVTVTGTFHAACVAHGGELDLHATKVEVASEGKTGIAPAADMRIGIAALVLIGVGIALFVHYQRRALRGS